LIANCLRIARNRAHASGKSLSLAEATVDVLIDDLACELARSYDNFNRAKFLAACRGDK
jgi:hypothetical protein